MVRVGGVVEWNSRGKEVDEIRSIKLEEDSGLPSLAVW